MNKKTSVVKRVLEYEQLMILLLLVVICVILSFLSEDFLTKGNILNILRQASMTGICAIGMTMLILLGAIDLSVGSTQAMVGVTTVFTLVQTESVFIAVIAGLICGAIIGVVNGFIVTKLQIMPLIATLGTMSIISGLIRAMTGSVSIQSTDKTFAALGNGYLGPIPIPVVILFVLFGIFWYILNFTAFGRYIYAIGGNEGASRLAGIPVDRIKMTVFILSGVLAGVSAVILSARMGSGQPTAGLGFELDVIAAVIVGGVSMAGGRGSLFGAMLGVLILTVLLNGLVLLDINSFLQDVLTGAVIILAAYVDNQKRKSSAKKLESAHFNEA